MFDHVKFGVSDYAASKAFFLKALEPLGVTVVTEWPPNGVERLEEECFARCIVADAEFDVVKHEFS